MIVPQPPSPSFWMRITCINGRVWTPETGWYCMDRAVNTGPDGQLFSFLWTVLIVFLCFCALYVVLRLIAFLSGKRELSFDNMDEQEDREIQTKRDKLRFEQIEILEGMGSPAMRNGDNSPEQKMKWSRVRELERQDAAIVAKTQVKNLDPLGHNIGRVWISGRNPRYC